MIVKLHYAVNGTLSYAAVTGEEIKHALTPPHELLYSNQLYNNNLPNNHTKSIVAPLLLT